MRKLNEEMIHKCFAEWNRLMRIEPDIFEKIDDESDEDAATRRTRYLFKLANRLES